MGRKSKQTDYRARRYIRILDDEKWAFIDKLSKLDKYKNSFNMLINDALSYGLPELLKSELNQPELPEAELSPSGSASCYDINAERYFMEVVLLLKEVIVNETINKSLLCSLFNAKETELAGKPVSGKLFSTGGLRDTPDYLSGYELRALKELRG